jgi:hypothetical protein
MAIRKSRAQWAEVLAKFVASGETIAGFCARHRLSPRSLTWWRWRLRREGREVGGTEEVRLVAVDVPQPLLRATGSVGIVLGEFEVRVDVGTDVAYVAGLVAALRSRC